MFQICVFDLKHSRKGTNTTFLKRFFNVIIKKNKIHNIYDIIKISKYVELDKCDH
jgi:hypothetical protein